MITAPSRRGFLLGLTSLLAAPAIVRASSLMPVRAIAKIESFNLAYPNPIEAAIYRDQFIAAFERSQSILRAAIIGEGAAVNGSRHFLVSGHQTPAPVKPPSW